MTHICKHLGSNQTSINQVVLDSKYHTQLQSLKNKELRIQLGPMVA